MMYDYRFCPRCAHPLESKPIRHDGDRVHPVCPNCGFIYYADPKVAAGTIFEWNGGLLLTRRAHRPAYGRWVFPGGYVNRGEEVQAAAVRETQEETGLEVVVDGLLGVYSFAGNPVMIVVYRAHVIGGRLTPCLAECLEVRSFPPADLPWHELAFMSTELALQDWLRADGRTKDVSRSK